MSSDEIRPGYLQLQSSDAKTFLVLWKLPSKYNVGASFTPIFPDSCINEQPKKIAHNKAEQSKNIDVQYWTIYCHDGLLQQTIAIDGLKNSALDVLVRLQLPDGISHMVRLTSNTTSFTFLPEVNRWQVISLYTGLGIEHILLGFDHLLFVFALLLIITSRRRLLGAITAFTVAHSMTLTLASLNLVLVPLPPVEAVIALSIVFLAVEIVHAQRGQVGIAARSPWLVAFTFGLLHGFGFAGALAEIGLPENALPLALLFFNIGVELGQLAFIISIWLMSRLFISYMTIKNKRIFLLSCAYAIGSLASYWVIERTLSFFI